MELDSDLIACAELVQRADPDRFLAAMAAPVEARKVLFPIYALNVEVSRAPWVTQEPMIAEMRLQWWRDMADEIASGGPVRRHQVATPLSRVISAHLAGLLDEYVAARRWDIYKDPFEDETHFDTYIDCSAGSLMVVAAQALGQADEGVVRDFAYASGVANWLCAVSELEARGKIPMLDGRPEGIRGLATVALDRLHKARTRRHLISAEARPAMLSGWRAGPLLAQAAKDPARVAQGTLGQSEFRRRASLMWRAATGRW